MSLYVVSDESGDIGPYIPGSKRSGTKLYSSMSVCAIIEEAISGLGSLALELAKKYFSPPYLRKWTNLPGSIKNNPELLLAFVSELISEHKARYQGMLAAYSVIEKELIQNRYFSQRGNKRLLVDNRMLVYEMAFKRILPFIKKAHYVLGGYPQQPSIKWYLDINQGDFQGELRGIIERYMKDYGAKVSLRFVPKNSNDRHTNDPPMIREAIRAVDILAGICNKAFQLHLECPHASDSCPGLRTQEACLNGFSKVWAFIQSNLISGVNCMHNQQPFWRWHGMIYIPVSSRILHQAFIGSDPFLHH